MSIQLEVGNAVNCGTINGLGSGKIQTLADANKALRHAKAFGHDGELKSLLELLNAADTVFKHPFKLLEAKLLDRVKLALNQAPVPMDLERASGVSSESGGSQSSEGTSSLHWDNSVVLTEMTAASTTASAKGVSESLFVGDMGDSRGSKLICHWLMSRLMLLKSFLAF